MKDVDDIELQIGDFVEQVNNDVIGQIVAIVAEKKAFPYYKDVLSDEIAIDQGLSDGVYLYTLSMGLIYVDSKIVPLIFKLILRNEEFNREFENFIIKYKEIVNSRLDLMNENKKLKEEIGKLQINK